MILWPPDDALAAKNKRPSSNENGLMQGLN